MSTRILYVRIKCSMNDLICDVISCCVVSCDIYQSIWWNRNENRENMEIEEIYTYISI